MSICCPVGVAVTFLGLVFCGVGAYHLMHDHLTEGWLLAGGGVFGVLAGVVLLMLWFAFGRGSVEADYNAPYYRGQRRGGDPWGG